MKLPITHGSLFSGTGGFDIAAEAAGFKNLFHCEIDETASHLLKFYWPQANHYNDVKNADFTIWNNRITVLSGGFPCQPYSVAGQRKGKNDERHLWPYMLRAIQQIQPRWVVAENVHGITNWNEGVVFEEVCAEMEAQGYEVQPYVLPASGINAPHKRYRVWFVGFNVNANPNNNWFGKLRKPSEQTRPCEGNELPRSECSIQGENSIGSNPNSNGQQQCNCNYEKLTSETGQYAQHDISKNGEQRLDTNSASNRRKRKGQKTPVEERYQEKPDHVGQLSSRFEGLCSQCNASHPNSKRNGKNSKINQTKQPNPNGQERGIFTNANSERFQSTEQTREILQAATQYVKTQNWNNWPTQSPVCGGDDGVPTQLDGITIPKWRNESIKQYGNAIVPQLALRIFESIAEYEKLHS